MGTGGGKSVPALGFLTVVENDQHGLFGGYLILNFAGRPLEFHCTVPVKPNRAQQILYGATLQPYLYGEQIGQTLLNKGSLQPVAVCTDRSAVLAVREHVDLPVALVLPSGQPVADAPAAAVYRIDGAEPIGAPTVIRVGRNSLLAPPRYEEDADRIRLSLNALGESFDLAEPFDRIREALEEAQRGTK